MRTCSRVSIIAGDRATSEPRLKFPAFSIEVFRGRLASANALPQLALLGMLTGLVTAMVIIAFRFLIEGGGMLILGVSAEEYESLDMLSRVLSVMSGAAILALLLHRYRPSARRVGIVHVMERLSRHQGYLPLKNAVIQFLGGAIALISGQSGGREGPAVHLGATTASLFGQVARLPNNSIRTMVACGTAAAIASSFNTPIAAVIFAMEVVMMEYTIASFIPVIVAAVASTLVTQLFFGTEPAFIVPALQMYSFLEIPYLLVGGVLVGCLAAGYIQLVQFFARTTETPFWMRMILAGSMTAGFAVVLPQVMGIGYDTVNGIMQSQIPLLILVALFAGKALTSAAAVGFGMPVGLIGPTMVLGACLGGVFAALLNTFQDAGVSVAFYVILGMGAMMAAVLQAPLAALMAVMEMTANTSIILPAMVIIIVATLITSELFKQKSVFITTLNTLGLQYPPNPISLHLQRVGAIAIMDRSFRRLPTRIPNSVAQEVIDQGTNWILVEDDAGDVRALLNPSDLDAFLSERGVDEEEIRLLELPGRRMDVTSIGSQATALQIQQAMLEADAQACTITRMTAPMIKPIIGIVTQNHIDNYRNRIE